LFAQFLESKKLDIKFKVFSW